MCAYGNGILQVLAVMLRVREWNTASTCRYAVRTGMEHCKYLRLCVRTGMEHCKYLRLCCAYGNGTLKVLAVMLRVREWNAASTCGYAVRTGMEYCKYLPLCCAYGNGTLQVLAVMLRVREWNAASTCGYAARTGMEYCKYLRIPYMFSKTSITCEFSISRKINPTCNKFTQNFCLKQLRNRIKIKFFKLLTYSMVQSPSSSANWFAASQEIPRISRNPKVHYRTHKCPPPVSILGQPNPVHIPTTHLVEIRPNIIHTSTPRSPQWLIQIKTS